MKHETAADIIQQNGKKHDQEVYSLPPGVKEETRAKQDKISESLSSNAIEK